MVGAWPIEKSRLLAYAEKAAREAKVHTSWTDPVPAYEEAVRKFIDGIYDDSSFVEALNQFVASLIYPGRINSLAQTLLKLTAPGVPDFYQGTELWNLALVDPDNRRPAGFRSATTPARRSQRRNAGTGDGAFRRGHAEAVADPARHSHCASAIRNGSARRPESNRSKRAALVAITSSHSCAANRS